ncbi:MAG: hypothetical protein HY606_10520 [Planctomycetes bacterium]|nr:hypothetical protein [Planctomycetota bacterium]
MKDRIMLVVQKFLKNFQFTQKGSILLLTLAVLALLSLLAVALVSLQTVSKMESSRYIEALEAKWLTQTGFERAIAELKKDPFRSDMDYWGSDANENGIEDPGEAQDVNMDGVVSEEEKNIWNIDVEWAQNPSLAYMENDRLLQVKVAPVRVKDSEIIGHIGEASRGRTVKVGVTGISSKGSYAKGSNCYSLKISDLQSRLFLNDGLEMYGGNQSTVSQNLKRIVNELAANPDVIGENSPDDFGQKLIDARPPTGFRSRFDVRRALEKLYGVEKGRKYFRKIKDYVCVNAWVDKNVVNPVPLSESVYNEYPVYYFRKGGMVDLNRGPVSNVDPGTKPYVNSQEMPSGFGPGPMTFRRGRGVNSVGEYRFNKVVRNGSITESLRWFDSKYLGDSSTSDIHNAIYALDELFPQYIETVHRAPINVNRVSEQLLIALLTDISGFFITERRRFAPYAPSPEFKFKYNPYPDVVSGGGMFGGGGACSGGGTSTDTTVPRRYVAWEYTGYTYDAGGYDFNVTNPGSNVNVKYDGDEYGYLYRTVPLRPSWKKSTGAFSTSDQYLDAKRIAKHIIACRKKKDYEGINYETLPFGGEFKTWNQMYRFFDYLVETGIIRDDRNIFWNYLFNGWESPSAGDWSYDGIASYPQGKSDPAQKEYASYAIADALKANFNPNMHLNEINPNENMWMRVDKTDLIVNSTELCFTPMGYFEIESVGRIFKPVDELKENQTIFDAQVVREVARKFSIGVVKIFDVYRESTQRHFMQGTVSDKSGTASTNSGAGLEMGPEIYNSIAIRGESERCTLEDNWANFKTVTDYDLDGWRGYSQKDQKIETGWGSEYDGWIQLSTIGGDEMGNRLGKSLKGKIINTPAGQQHWPLVTSQGIEGIHSHFALDYKAHYHGSSQMLGDSIRGEVGSREVISPKTITESDRQSGNIGLDPPLFDPNYREKLATLTSCSMYWDGYDQYYNSSVTGLFTQATSGPIVRKLDVNLSGYKKVERATNYADDLKDERGPYDAKTYHRIARSFRMSSDNAKGAGSELELQTYAPSDLRIDGAYVERNSGIAYWIDESRSMFTYGGLASMWIKPSFFPEHTGKVRKLFSYDRWHKGYQDMVINTRKHYYEYKNPDMFSLFFMPAHDAPPYTDSATENASMQYTGKLRSSYYRRSLEMPEYEYKSTWPIRPASLLGGMYQHWASGSLDDWEHLDPTVLPMDGLLMFGGINYGFELWAGKPDDTFSLLMNGTSPQYTEVDKPVTGPANKKDGRRHHCIDFETYCNTPPLNHNLHKDGLGSASKPVTTAANPQRNYLEAHRWTHVVWTWLIKYNRKEFELLPDTPFLPGMSFGSEGYYEMPIYAAEHEMKIIVNGKELFGTSKVPYEQNVKTQAVQKLWMKGGRRPTFSINSLQDVNKLPDTESPLGSNYFVANTFRIGEVPFNGFTFNNGTFQKENLQQSMWPRNYSGDFTVDEFYLIGCNDVNDNDRKTKLDKTANEVRTLFNIGRYYVPGSSSDCVFESGNIYFLEGETKRKLANESKVFDDEGNRVGTKEIQIKENIKLLGMQWTWFSEDYDRSNMAPVVYDYLNEVSFNGKPTGSPLVQGNEANGETPPVAVDLTVYSKGGSAVSTFSGTNSGLTLIEHQGKNYYELKEDEFIKYKVNFNIRGASTSSVLLSTPFFDDVSIFYSDGVKVVWFVTAVQ